MKDEIKALLEELGLTKGEIEVYVALSEIGTSTTGAIIKKAKVSSSKIYEILNKLAEKGLVSFVIERGKQNYTATSPERLIDFLEDKKRKLSEDQEKIKNLLPLLKAERKEGSEVVVYRGKKGPLIALQEAFDATKAGEELLGFGTDEDDYLKYFHAQTMEFIKQEKKHKMKVRLLFGEGFKSPNKDADVRHLPKGFSMPIRTMVYGDKVAIVDFTNPMITIVINKKEVAEAYRNHFEVLWKIAKK